MTLSVGIGTGGASAIAELEILLGAAGLSLTGMNVYGSIRGIMVANEMKEASTTMHEAKKAAKVMAESIAKLTLDVINVICTVAGYFKGKKKIVNKETNQALLKKSSVSEEDLIKYLESIDNYNAKNKGTVTNYALEYKNKGKWPDEVQIPRQESFLDKNGCIDWETWAPNGGREGVVLKGEDFSPQKGSLIDRYGSPDGRYASPIIDGKPYAYEQRSLPFVEDSRQYHVYEVQFDSIFECINSIKDEKLRIALLSEYKTIAFSNEKFIFSSSKIAPAFNQQGGGIQYEFGFTIKTLLKIGYLKEK